MVFEKVKNILAAQFDVDEDSITMETDILEDLGADSLDLFELIMMLEDEYNMEFPADELAGLNTVGDVIEYLKQNGIDA